MKGLILICAAFLSAAFLFCGSAFSEEKVIFDFETGTEGWWIPEWSEEKGDYATKALNSSEKFAKRGKSSIEVISDFPKEGWHAGIVDVEGPFDWSKYKKVKCDIYAPKNAPPKLKARLAITVGEKWLWLDLARAVNLEPGEWVTVSGNLELGNDAWKRTKMVEKKGRDGKIYGYVEKAEREPLTQDYVSDIKVFSIRIEAENNPYSGPVYIDNIRLAD